MTSVLLVDDDGALRAATLRFLKSLGCEAHGVESAELALEELAVRNFDLVVTDLQMHSLSGLDLIEHMLMVAPGTPSILVSGGLQPEDHERAQELGVIRVLAKPYSFVALASAIGEALGSLRPPRYL
jgi:two-component system response regulator FlrC